jgi:hypothetical protein
MLKNRDRDLNKRTYFPVLQLYSLNVSSSPAVTTWSPRSSKLMPVICLIPELGDFEDADGTGPGSTAVLNILAGFSFPCHKVVTNTTRATGNSLALQ